MRKIYFILLFNVNYHVAAEISPVIEELEITKPHIHNTSLSHNIKLLIITMHTLLSLLIKIGSQVDSQETFMQVDDVIQKLEQNALQDEETFFEYSNIQKKAFPNITTNITPRTREMTDQEEVQYILGSFANVMQCFFRIVQDPENPTTITNGLIGMFTNMLQAGRIIMKGSDIFLDEDKAKVQQKLNLIEQSQKRQLIALFIKKMNHVQTSFLVA